MDCKLKTDIALNSFFCPNCHSSKFSPHWMTEYNHEWNKCTSCGYMELQSITETRILYKLNPNQFIEPFKDPIFDIKKKTINMCIHCKNIKTHNKNNCNCNCSNCN